MARKRRRLKVKNILILIVSIIVIFLLFSLVGKLFKNNNFKVEVLNEPIVVDKNGFIDIEFKATYKDEDVTDLVKVIRNSTNYNINKYKITFKYEKENKEYLTSVSVKIKDKVAPVITLNEGEEISWIIGTEYKEPGYSAKDNFDKDITSKVKTTGKVDYKTAGSYTITYKVSDSSNNETEINRIVKVVDNPLELDKKDFSLSGFYPNALIPKSDYDAKYADSFIFAGDSVALYYVMNKIIPGSRLWHKEGINPETALTNHIYVNHQETGKTFKEVFKEKQPERVVLTLGTNSAAFMEVDFFISNYKQLVEDIKEVSPNTLLVIQAIPPVAKVADDKGKLTNDKINKLNYHLLKMCSELNVPFLNSAEVLKDKDGNLKDEYARLNEASTPGVHLSAAGNKVIYDYLNSHVIK